MPVKPAPTGAAPRHAPQPPPPPAVPQEERNYLTDPSAWEQNEGHEYGGQSPIVLLAPGDVAGPFTYVTSRKMRTEMGETDGHTATDAEGQLYRLPIQATFQKALDESGVERGDVFLIRRDADVMKKRGPGQGKPMAIYRVKVIQRVQRVDEKGNPVDVPF